MNCRSKNVIYLPDCTHYQNQYVGKSEWLFYFRLNNSRRRIKSMNQNNLVLDEQYFWTNCHNFNRDTKFAIIERIGKHIDMKSIIGEKKDKWIKSPKVQLGFYMKLNPPNWKQ